MRGEFVIFLHQRDAERRDATLCTPIMLRAIRMARSGTSERSVTKLWLRTVGGVGAGLLTLWLTNACQTSCNNNHTGPISYVDGKITTSGSTRTYESTPWDGEWLDFPGNRRFLLEHGLHIPPQFTSVQMYIAFNSNPIPTDGDAGDVAPATGDVAVVEKMTDTQLQIYNDTCSEQYIYVRIKGDIPESDAGQ